MLPYSHTHTHSAAQRTRRKSQNASAAFRGAFSRLLKSFAQRQENASNNNNNKYNDKRKEGEKIVFYYDDICCIFFSLLLSFSLFLLLPYFYAFCASTAVDRANASLTAQKWQVASGKLRTARGLALKFASSNKKEWASWLGCLAHKVDWKFKL